MRHREYFTWARDIAAYTSQVLRDLGSSRALEEEEAIELIRATRETQLVGRPVLQVDDELKNVLERFVGPIVAATRRRCEFVLHRRGAVDWIAGCLYERYRAMIDERQHPVLLMDAKLHNHVRGPQVAESILHEDDSVFIVGFSSVEKWRECFQQVGVSRFVLKDPENPIYSLQEVGTLLSKVTL